MKTNEGPFLSDVKELRRRAREHIEKGAVTERYRADLATVVKLLNEALATEIVCVLRYRRHHFMAQGLEAGSVATEFLQHAVEEQGHADELATRITQLNGEPNFNPEGMLSRSHSEYVEGATLLDMIREDLVAERVAIESYTEMIRYIGDDDPTTRRMLEGILAKEEEHAEDMANLLAAHAKLAGAVFGRTVLLAPTEREQAIDERPLIGVQELARALCDDELHAVDLPRRAGGCRPRGKLCRPREHAFSTLRVVDVTERDEGPRDVEPDLFAHLAAGGGFEALSFVRLALRERVWRLPVVSAGGVDDDDAQVVAATRVKQEPGRLFGHEARLARRRQRVEY